MRKSRRAALLVGLAAILIFPVALAQATSAPTANTRSATSVTGGGATLRGAVNPGGEPTNYAFQWGTTTGYGQQTPAASAGSGNGEKDVSSAITGLSPSTTYHFRVTATNASGTVVGNDEAFTTPATPGTSTSGTTSITASSAVVNGIVNPEGSSTSYYFQYGTSTSYGLQTTPGGAGSGTADVGVHATLTGLAANTVYHYRLVAHNGGGTSTGSDGSFTTNTSQTQSQVAFIGREGFVSPGAVIGVEAGCFGGTTSCAGHVTMLHDGVVIGQRNFLIAPNSGGFQNIGLSNQGKQLLKGNSVWHLLGVDVDVTTTTGQHASTVMHLARWVWH